MMVSDTTERIEIAAPVDIVRREDRFWREIERRAGDGVDGAFQRIVARPLHPFDEPEIEHLGDVGRRAALFAPRPVFHGTPDFSENLVHFHGQLSVLRTSDRMIARWRTRSTSAKSRRPPRAGQETMARALHWAQDTAAHSARKKERDREEAQLCVAAPVRF